MSHTHTLTAPPPSLSPCYQIVCNPPTYPNFLSFLAHKKVRTIPTSMTFSVSRDLGLFEWAGDNLSTVFIQRKNLLNPRLWRMLLDVLRFNLFGLDLVDGDQKDGSRGTAQSKKEDREEVEKDMSIGEYLERGGYGDGFKEDYLLVSSSRVVAYPWFFVGKRLIFIYLILIPADDSGHVSRSFTDNSDPPLTPISCRPIG